MFNLIRALDRYMASDQDTSSDPQYFGFVDHKGNWYILEMNITNGTMRYVTGRSDTSPYTTAWTNRATQTYDYAYNVVFYNV